MPALPTAAKPIGQIIGISQSRLTGQCRPIGYDARRRAVGRTVTLLSLLNTYCDMNNTVHAGIRQH